MDSSRPISVGLTIDGEFSFAFVSKFLLDFQKFASGALGGSQVNILKVHCGELRLGFDVFITYP